LAITHATISPSQTCGFPQGNPVTAYTKTAQTQTSVPTRVSGMNVRDEVGLT